MLWQNYALAGILGANVLAVANVDEAPSEFVTFQPCGFSEPDLDDPDVREKFILAPYFLRYDVRPANVVALAHYEGKPGSLDCTVVFTHGAPARPVLGKIDEVKVKLTRQ